jgi:hypothetical protein
MAYFSSSIYNTLVSVTGVDPGFVRPESYIIFGTLFKKSNTQLRNEFRYEIKYLFRKRKKSQQITKRLTYTTNITKSKKIIFFYKLTA